MWCVQLACVRTRALRCHPRARASSSLESIADFLVTILHTTNHASTTRYRIVSMDPSIGVLRISAYRGRFTIAWLGPKSRLVQRASDAHVPLGVSWLGISLILTGQIHLSQAFNGCPCRSRSHSACAPVLGRDYTRLSAVHGQGAVMGTGSGQSTEGSRWPLIRPGSLSAGRQQPRADEESNVSHQPESSDDSKGATALSSRVLLAR